MDDDPDKYIKEYLETTEAPADNNHLVRKFYYDRGGYYGEYNKVV